MQSWIFPIAWMNYILTHFKTRRKLKFNTLLTHSPKVMLKMQISVMMYFWSTSSGKFNHVKWETFYSNLPGSEDRCLWLVPFSKSNAGTSYQYIARKAFEAISRYIFMDEDISKKSPIKNKNFWWSTPTRPGSFS